MPVAAHSLNNFPPPTQLDQSAWVDTQINVAYKPNPPAEYIPPPPRPPRSTYCSCVNYVKALTGFRTSIGMAKYWPRNSVAATVGAVVITNESRYGHVAFIAGIEGNELILSEANYSRCRKTNGRRLNISAPSIIGYWIP